MRTGESSIEILAYDSGPQCLFGGIFGGRAIVSEVSRNSKVEVKLVLQRVRWQTSSPTCLFATKAASFPNCYSCKLYLSF